MIEFLALLIAHILADFYWQPTAWVASKRRLTWKARAFYAHIAVVTVTSYVLLGYWDRPEIALLLGLAHGVIDLVKLTWDKKESTQWFLTDQALHLLSIFLTAGLITHSLHASLDTLVSYLYIPENAAAGAGLLLCLHPVSFLVGMFTRPWRDELTRLAPGADDNLANAGRWIGISERLLIYAFVLLDQYAAIGFLIAAKSLLRYNDKHSAGIPSAYISKKSEYVLIGTLLSYTCSIGLALVVKHFFG